MEKSFPYECLESVDSTNTYLKDRPDLWSQNFYTVRAIRQTAGRGRYGRTWHSASGNLTFSFVYCRDLPLEISPITIYAGLALRKALGRITGKTIQLKWPNDVTFKGKKLGGILTEMVKNENTPAVIFGIGVNLYPDQLPGELAGSAISLKEILGSSTVNALNPDLHPETILNDIMVDMQEYLQSYQSPLPQNILSEFATYNDPGFNMVSVFDEDQKVMVKKPYHITGINERGLLKVVDEHGQVAVINACEVQPG